MYESNLADADSALTSEGLKDILSRIEKESAQTGILPLSKPGEHASKIIYAKSEYNNWIYLTLLEQAREYLKVSISIGISKTYGSLLENKEAAK